MCLYTSTRGERTPLKYSVQSFGSKFFMSYGSLISNGMYGTQWNKIRFCLLFPIAYIPLSLGTAIAQKQYMFLLYNSIDSCTHSRSRPIGIFSGIPISFIYQILCFFRFYQSNLANKIILKNEYVLYSNLGSYSFFWNIPVSS